ncbi:MAG: flap endonuclease-1 [Methanocalculaceae archaeon]|jgi:flap endonuclease-1|nr:flap endonuclease-1 [Methanocalculaceae archaeon]
MGVALRPLLADYKTSLSWDELGGIAAIDAYNALYQFLSGIRQPDGTPLMDGAGRITSHLSGILFRTANLVEKNITPVYVFDGKPPVFKEATLAARWVVRENAKESWDRSIKEGDVDAARKYAMASSRVDAFVKDSSKEILTAMGIPWIQAPEEGEAQSAYMAVAGDVTYAVSQDYDSLLFGTPKLLRNLTISGKRRIHGKYVLTHPELLVLDEVLSGQEMTRIELIAAALLIGTDYNSGVKGVGPKTAVKLVHEGKFAERIVESENAADPEELIRYFLNPPVEKNYTIVKRAPMQEKVFEILCEEHGFSEERVSAGLARLGAKKGQLTLDSWF